MRVVVGPVSAQSANAWLAYARGVVDELDHLAPDQCFSTPEVRAIFDDYVSDWETTAAAGGTFTWQRDVAAEQAEYHVHAFHQVATMLERREQESGRHHAPPEGEEFYRALLTGVLAALEAESAASSEFAQHLLQFWPGHERMRP